MVWENSAGAWSVRKIPGGGAPQRPPQRYPGSASPKGLVLPGPGLAESPQAPPIMGLLWSCSFSSANASGKQEEAQG